jgi:hypothetical protein
MAAMLHAVLPLLPNEHRDIGCATRSTRSPRRRPERLERLAQVAGAAAKAAFRSKGTLVNFRSEMTLTTSFEEEGSGLLGTLGNCKTG